MSEHLLRLTEMYGVSEIGIVMNVSTSAELRFRLF